MSNSACCIFADRPNPRFVERRVALKRGASSPPSRNSPRTRAPARAPWSASTASSRASPAQISTGSATRTRSTTTATTRSPSMRRESAPSSSTPCRRATRERIRVSRETQLERTASQSHSMSVVRINTSSAFLFLNILFMISTCQETVTGHVKLW